MNKRIKELAQQATDKWVGGEFFDREKFAELIVREFVSSLQVNGSDFYHNEANDYGCITVNYFVPGNPNLMFGEEVKTKFRDEMRGSGRFRLNEKFVEHIMKSHFGVEE